MVRRYNVKIYKTTSCKEFEQLASAFIEPRYIIHITDKPCAWTGQLNTLNRTECERRDIDIGQGEYLGGSIVNMPGDLTICIITWGNSNLPQQIVDTTAKWLSERKISIVRDENDILADGKKVISWARATTLQGWCQSAVHFSIGPMDLALVKAICTKPMKKIPGSLSEYGITAEMILNEIHIEGD